MPSASAPDWASQCANTRPIPAPPITSFSATGKHRRRRSQTGRLGRKDRHRRGAVGTVRQRRAQVGVRCQFPAPVRVVARVGAPFPDLGGECGPKPVPPVPDRLVTNVDAAFEQDVFDLAQVQRIADVEHHREADDFQRGFEIPEGIGLHLHRLRVRALPLERVFSDSAGGRAPHSGDWKRAILRNPAHRFTFFVSKSNAYPTKSVEIGAIGGDQWGIFCYIKQLVTVLPDFHRTKTVVG